MQILIVQMKQQQFESDSAYVNWNKRPKSVIFSKNNNNFPFSGRAAARLFVGARQNILRRLNDFNLL